MLSSWLLFLKMNEVFDLSLKEFILWIRRQKKGKFYFCQDAAPEQHTHWWEVSSVRGPSGEVGPLQVQVHGFQQQEEISSSSYFLTTRQPRPITLGPCPCLGKHLQRITAGNSPTLAAPGGEKSLHRTLGLGNVFSWNRMLITYQSSGFQDNWNLWF